MRDGFKIITNFLDENQIDNMEKFVMKLPIFPKFIQTILAHRHKEYKFDRDDMDRLFIYLMRDDDSQARA
tara:strand:- start:752 stop:961 length:210 start_codon:yes stop_codon:yes gene_type:complete